MPHAATNWLTRSDAPIPDPRVPPAMEYHRVYSGEKRRIPRGIFGILLLLIGLVGSAQLFSAAATFIDVEVLDRTGFTPLQQAAGALSLGVLIPYCMVLQRILYKVPFRSLHSVIGRFRLAVFGRALLAFGPLVIIVMSVMQILAPSPPAPWTPVDLVSYFLIGILLTPLAAAGEEYGFRGFMFRVVGGWARNPRIGTTLGIAIPTVLFAFMHGSLDPYILISYFVLFGSMAIVTWRTGGLETAVVLHGLYNLTALVLATALHIDIAGQLNSRGEAVGSYVNLIPSAALILISAAVWAITRTSGPARTPAAAITNHATVRDEAQREARAASR